MPHAKEASPVIDDGIEPEPRLVLQDFETTTLVGRLLRREELETGETFQLSPSVTSATETDPQATEEFILPGYVRRGNADRLPPQNLVDKITANPFEVTLEGHEAEVVMGVLCKAATRSQVEEGEDDDTETEADRQRKGDDLLADLMIESYDPESMVLAGLRSEPKDPRPLDEIRQRVEAERKPNRVVSVEDHLPASVLGRKEETGEHVAVFRNLKEVITTLRLVERTIEEQDTPAEAHICEEVEAALAKLTDKIKFSKEENPYLVEGEAAQVIEHALRRGAERAMHDPQKAEITDVIAAEILGITDGAGEVVVDVLPSTGKYKVLPVAA